MNPETEQLVQRAGRLGLAVDNRLAAAFLVPALQREGADGSAETAMAELFADADRLELANSVLIVGPDVAVRGEATIRRLDDAIERFAVRPLCSYLDEARLGDARGPVGARPDLAMDRDAFSRRPS